MPTLRIAQLASFAGNFGDSANVLGTRRKLRENLRPLELEFSDLEYLDYDPDPLWRRRSFDAEFVALANRHDALIIGGGGFFELALDASSTGTPIDLSIEQMKTIKAPIIFHGLGFDASYGITDARREKFGRFLSFITAAPNILVSVRNDGSLEKIAHLYGPEVASRIDKIPDGGFFATAREYEHVELRPGRRGIALNLAGDNQLLRFPDQTESKPARFLFGARKGAVAGSAETALDRFLGALAGALAGALDRDSGLDLVLVPHIPEDLNLIDKFVARLGPPYSRRRVTVAPYVHGMESCAYILDLYRRCDLIIGMRFHANVCGVGLGRPVIGLGSLYPKVEQLFVELGLAEQCLSVSELDLRAKLEAKIAQALASSHLAEGIARQRDLLEQQLGSFHAKIKKLFAGRGSVSTAEGGISRCQA